MKIDISVQMADKSDDKYKRQDICSKCKDYMEVCESDNESRYHFDYLKALYKKLTSIANKPEHLKQLTLDLEEFMMKHGSVDNSTDNQVDLDHRTMEKLK